MQVSVGTQAYIFCCSAAGGVLIAFIYDVFRVKRKAVKTGRLAICLEDILYWFIVAVIMLALVYYSNDGEVRGFTFLGVACGIAIYILLFSRIVLKSLLFIARTAYRVLRFVFIVVTYPLKLIFKILAVPAGFFAGHFGRALKKGGRAASNTLARASLQRKLFKNMRKKI